MPWVDSSLFKQGPGESLAELPRFDDGPSRVHFRHVVHAYVDTAVPANNVAQSITFNTIRTARSLCPDDISTSCAVVTFPEEMHLVPPDCDAVPELRRVVTDVATFSEPRRLPLLFDILNLGAGALTQYLRSDNDFVILTNSDIHVQPYFYLAATEIIRAGYDVCTINRRTIGGLPDLGRGLGLMYGDGGNPHPGYDCFIFPARLVSQFACSLACVGAPFVMRSLLLNLAAHAGRFAMLTTAHLTFHIGNDRYWADSRFRDYADFNVEQARQVAVSLADGSNGRGRLTTERLSAFVPASAELARLSETAKASAKKPI